MFKIRLLILLFSFYAVTSCSTVEIIKNLADHEEAFSLEHPKNTGKNGVIFKNLFIQRLKQHGLYDQDSKLVLHYLVNEGSRFTLQSVSKVPTRQSRDVYVDLTIKGPLEGVFNKIEISDNQKQKRIDYFIKKNNKLGLGELHKNQYKTVTNIPETIIQVLIEKKPATIEEALKIKAIDETNAVLLIKKLKKFDDCVLYQSAYPVTQDYVLASSNAHLSHEAANEKIFIDSSNEILENMIDDLKTELKLVCL